jgi:hypothetical protein
MHPGLRVIRATVALATGTRSALANRGDDFMQLSGHPAGEANAWTVVLSCAERIASQFQTAPRSETASQRRARARARRGH